MNKSLILVRIDSNYCDYLRTFDNRVPYNYNDKEMRPFVGVLFYVGTIMYFAPLSSPKLKHIKIKQKIDFLKLDNGKLGAINFNNMLPVTSGNIMKINLNAKSKNMDEKYRKLLEKQIFWLNRNSNKLYSKSKKLYDKYIDGTLNINIKMRCCNFPLLEEKCIEYNNKNSYIYNEDN